MTTSNVPKELHYTTTHEWIRQNEDGTITIGITDHAQALLGDMVYVELPELHKVVKAGAEVAVVESVKAASDVYSPVSGEIIAINEIVVNQPELINNDAYGEGWLWKIKPSDMKELAQLLDAKSYETQVAAEEA